MAKLKKVVNLLEDTFITDDNVKNAEHIKTALKEIEYDKTLGNIDAKYYVNKQSLNKYYTPSLVEFKVGFIYEYNMMGSWEQRMLHDMDLVPDFNNHCDFMTIAYNFHNSRRSNLYRVKYLDSDDFEMLGFKIENMDGTTVTYVKNNLKIEHVPDNCIVRVFIDDEYVFRGKLLNFSELKEMLVKINVLRDEHRDNVISNRTKK